MLTVNAKYFSDNIIGIIQCEEKKGNFRGIFENGKHIVYKTKTKNPTYLFLCVLRFDFLLIDSVFL